jgi:ferric-dicitrate binding protein FerR (iron transport regulator)
MTTHENIPRREDQEADLERILHDVGARAQPTHAMFDEVRAAVEAEWRTVVAERAPKAKRWPWAVAAGVAAAALGVAVLLQPPSAPPALVATIARVSGAVEARDSVSGPWYAVEQGSTLLEGTELRTIGGARVALDFASGLSMRMDRDSQLALNDVAHASLDAGAVYVDSGTAGSARHAPLEIETSQGSVTHLGTQYEARLDAQRLVVTVREGRVSVARGSDRVQGAAGERLTIGAGGFERSRVGLQGGDWAWAGEIAPAYAVEGRSLQEFLAWVGRETGREIDYSDANARDAAVRLVLHGSVDGLTPEQALEAVLATAGMPVSVGEDRIRVETR